MKLNVQYDFKESFLRRGKLQQELLARVLFDFLSTRTAALISFLQMEGTPSL